MYLVASVGFSSSHSAEFFGDMKILKIICSAKNNVRVFKDLVWQICNAPLMIKLNVCAAVRLLQIYYSLTVPVNRLIWGHFQIMRTDDMYSCTYLIYNRFLDFCPSWHIWDNPGGLTGWIWEVMNPSMCNGVGLLALKKTMVHWFLK